MICLNEQSYEKLLDTNYPQPIALKQSTRNLSLGYTEIAKKEDGAGTRSFWCDLLLGCFKL